MISHRKRFEYWTCNFYNYLLFLPKSDLIQRLYVQLFYFYFPRSKKKEKKNRKMHLQKVKDKGKKIIIFWDMRYLWTLYSTSLFFYHNISLFYYHDIMVNSNIIHWIFSKTTDTNPPYHFYNKRILNTLIKTKLLTLEIATYHFEIHLADLIVINVKHH